jgi:hypothetical protein
MKIAKLQFKVEEIKKINLETMAKEKYANNS